MKKCLLFIGLICFLSCGDEELMEHEMGETAIDEFSLQYSFFVAGHTYGNPLDIQYGLYDPFADQIPYLNNYAEMELGVLTGDVVASSTQVFWDSAFVDINMFSMPVHIAAGNHDRGPVFDSLFDDIYSFWNEDDLFIILSPTEWNIENEQKDFLFETINSNSSKADNIFIFCHELIWWSPENDFKNVEINYAPHYPGSTNYWSEISPFLESVPNDIVIFAGDLGATSQVSAYMYYEYDNIELIASGMGGGEEDNIIIVEVGENGDFKFKLVGLNEDMPFSLGELTEYKLP